MEEPRTAVSTTAPRSHFIREAIQEDLRSGRFSYVQTRFPPEPNGYLHIGHTKAFAIDFDMAAEFGGLCSLRFDDTNPAKEETEYVDAIMEDIRWMGYDWGERLYFASGYFERLYEWALELIKKGLAYVCDLSPEEVKAYRGTLTEPGRNSPYRERTVAENLDLFARMRAGEFPDGSRTLRAKIDMAAPNINLRDPVMYRILRKEHHRTGNAWCIYPMYDWTHGQNDSMEGVTHSLCDLGYEDHRPLYDWFLDRLGVHHPRQIEFARLHLTYTVLSKRFLRRMVEEGRVSGWDDPRMPTLRGMRRRGYTPEAVHEFLKIIGVDKTNSIIDIELLEHCLRQDLNRRALRRMAVLRPLRLIVDNYPEGQVEEMACINNPEDPAAGSRPVPFSRELYIEREDFMEDPPKKFWRLFPGNEVRLRYAYLVTCTGVVKDAQGNVVEVHCTYDPATRGGDAPDGRKVKSTLHWVAAAHAVPAEVRLYDRLFTRPNPMDTDDEEGEAGDFVSCLNPNSLEVLAARVEPSLRDAPVGSIYQFERQGYFCADPDTTAGRPVFNRSVALRDTWARESGIGDR